MSTDSTGGDAAHLLPATSQLRRSRRLWRILFFMALAVAALALAVRFVGDAGVAGSRIARINIHGTIATDPDRVAAIKRLADNPLVEAVIVSINSPGGTTAGGEELYEALEALRAEKPVVAVIHELGASAAYMTAIGAERIFARRLSIVGSIGVLYQHVNVGRLLDNIGVDFDKVATGPLKAEPDFDEPISPQVRESLQALVGDSFEWFVDIVAERRGLTRVQTLSLADGRIITGRQAVEARLIDAIGGEAEAIAWLESERQVSADLPVRDAYPLREEGWMGLPRWLGSAAREALGLQGDGPIALDGLVSLWQVGATS
jgi:protease IV